jgi:predicted metal-dependent peptidase
MKTNNSVYKALIMLEKSCPDLFLLIKNVKIESCQKTPTAYAKIEKSGFKIVINESWVDSFDSYNLASLIEHEILHIILNHLSDKNYSNKKLANVAMDSIINEIGVFISDRKKLNDELNKGVFLKELNEKFNSSFSASKNTVKEIYDFLMGQKEDDLEDLTSFDEGLSESTDSIESSEIAKTIESIIDSKDLDKIIKSYSKNSKELKTQLDRIEKIEKNKKIVQAINHFFASNKNDSKKSIKRVNKRFNFLPYGKIKDSTQKILIALDVSGSMINPDEIEKMKITISSATNYGFNIDLIFGDTKKLGEFKNIKKNFDFSQVFGGGGTDLRFIFEDKLSDYDCLVVLTDGYFNHNEIPLKHKNSILFLNTSKDPIKNFKNLFI